MEQPEPQPRVTVDGNALTLLDTGQRRLQALLELIAGATRSLRLLYYIYADDETGAKVRQGLVDAAARGVAVALIVDGFGSEGASGKDFFQPIKDAGGSVCRFEPHFGRRYLLRNHQKLALADAELPEAARIIIGGFNVEDDYFGRPAKDGAWRDLGLLVEGPVTERLAGYFDALKNWIEGDTQKIRHLNAALSRWSEREGVLRWLIGGPTRRLSPWARAVRAEMRGARDIAIIAGYFTPSPTILRHLDRAAKRGQRVRIVTPAHADHAAAVAAARFTYAGLLKKGTRIFEYQPTKLHTKLYVIDDVVFIGSANFDMRSLFINLELMLRIEDKAFAAHMRGYVEGEIAQSREITEEDYRRSTGPLQRLRQFAAYMVMAVVDPSVSRGLNFGIE